MKRTALQAVAAALLLFAFDARADWAQSTDVLVVRAAPANDELQVQNPPSFTWSRHPSAPTRYDFQILKSDGVTVAFADSTPRNWYLPTKALPAGTYFWKVRPIGTTLWSDPRRFTLSTTTTVFEVPDEATLRAAIMGKNRPRALGPTFRPYPAWDTARKNTVEPYLSRLRNEVKLQVTALGPVSDASWPPGPTQEADIRNGINAVARQLEASALLYRAYGCTGPATPDANCKIFLDEAIRRGDELAALDPNGVTSNAKQDQANRQIAMSLAKAYDLLPNELGSTRQGTWLARVDARGEQIYIDLTGTGDVDQFPYDSHRTTAKAFLAALSPLMMGTLSHADPWFTYAFRSYANVPSPWSGPAGGYANGTAYAEYTAGYLVSLWDPIQSITGVNLYNKPWSVGFLTFMMQFTPPGQWVHAFGDGSEGRPDPRSAVALASRQFSPRAAWYHGKLSSTHLEDALTYLQAPYPLPVASTTFKGPPSNSEYFKSIGWTAMHSDINKDIRTSVFFKSSPYGSLNHSHGDQNGFLLSVDGKPFLMKAGVYTAYGSADWRDYYRQTRAQNAITLDGGKGQVVEGYRETLIHNGNITRFTAQPSYDFAEGDATPAYASALGITLHKRQLWYLRAENAVLVRDKLASTLGHTYEFNMHAPADFVAESGGVRRITSGGQAVCVVSGLADAVFTPVRYGGVVTSPQYHAAFTVTKPAGAAEFLVLFDVGCKNHRPVVTTSSTGVRTVTVGTQSFVLD